MSPADKTPEVRRVYVVINRTKAFIHGVTPNLERAREILEAALAEDPNDVIVFSHEPVLF